MGDPQVLYGIIQFVMIVFAACILCLTVESASSDVFRGYNRANNIVPMFRSTYNKYHGKNGIEELTKRESKGKINERLMNFRGMVEVVNDVNVDKSLSFTAGLNFLSVMTKEEISNLLTLDRVNISRYEAEGAAKQKGAFEGSFQMYKQPRSVNWVKRGALPPVKNQGGCGSCWAFSATTALEGNYFIETGDQVSFSDQEVLDCSTERAKRGHDGCRGGLMIWPYDYVKAVDRLALEKDFKYVAQDRACNVRSVPSGLKKARVSGWKQLPKSDSSLLEAAAEHVISVGIQSNTKDFMAYRSGIFVCTRATGCNCQVRGDHAVDLVGYGEGYWNIRNSWGPRWGDNGYIKMSRNQDNICLINTFATLPLFECRKGQKCKKWDGGSEDDDDDKEEEDEDKGFDTGKPVKCGAIKHFGGKCVDLADSGSGAVLTDIGCDREFCLTDKGYIQDKVTDKCLTISDPNRNNNLITFGACNGAHKWSETAKGFKIQARSGKCWHPYGGSPNPRNECKICIYSGCNDDRLTFKITESLCWEEISGKKLGKKLKNSKGKPLKANDVDDAKELCLETKGCKGLYLPKGKYFLSGSNKGQDSKKKGDKIFVITDCSKACAAGEQRCEDGECKERCDDDDDDCPPGTTRCPDGVCKHVHMCSH